MRKGLFVVVVFTMGLFMGTIVNGTNNNSWTFEGKVYEVRELNWLNEYNISFQDYAVTAASVTEKMVTIHDVTKHRTDNYIIYRNDKKFVERYSETWEGY